MHKARSGAEAPLEGGLILFARQRFDLVLQDWVRLATERGILLHDASKVLRSILDGPSSSREDADEMLILEPAQLAITFILLRRCILERWHAESDKDLDVRQLRELDEGMDRLAINAYAQARRHPQEPTLAREDVLAIVAHDLRNPLSTIILAASAVARTSDDSQAGTRIRRQSEVILRSAHQMDRFVSDLLDLSKPRENGLLAVTKLSCDGVKLAKEAVELLAPIAAARRHELLLDLAEEQFRLSCDPDRMAQILSNLIGNAAKFTPEAGRIVVAVRRSGDEIIFSVSDNGIGISPEQLPHIFEPYFQGYKGRSGLGLGLTVTRSLVRAHGGRIWVESAKGKGTSFFVALPAEPEDQPIASQTPDQSDRVEERHH